MKFLLAQICLTLAVMGCEREATVIADVERPSPTASAVMRDRDGYIIGNATFAEKNGGVAIDLDVRGLPSGQHGFHIHQIGKCVAPDFESAGGHFNPTQSEHGFHDPQGPHLGDLYNVTVESDGTAHAQRTIDGVHLGTGEFSLLREGRTALVIHAKPDDYESDPSGESGQRIACGVIQRD